MSCASISKYLFLAHLEQHRAVALLIMLTWTDAFFACTCINFTMQSGAPLSKAVLLWAGNLRTSAAMVAHPTSQRPAFRIYLFIISTMVSSPPCFTISPLTGSLPARVFKSPRILYSRFYEINTPRHKFEFLRSQRQFKIIQQQTKVQSLTRFEHCAQMNWAITTISCMC